MIKKSKNKLICLLIPTLQAGGMERVMSVLANYFVKKEDVEVVLVMYGKDPELFYELDKRIKIITPKRSFNNKRRMLGAFERLFFLRSTIRKVNPDTILSFGTYWNIFVLISLLLIKCPIFISDRGNPAAKHKFAYRILMKIFYPIAKCIIAQTSKAKEIYANKKLNKNIDIIGNPIRYIEKQENIIKENIIISVGRLVNTKNFDKLIDMFVNLKKTDWKLVIVGGDALNQKNSLKLQKKIDNLQLNENVILAGTQKNVDSYLLKSKIFAFTSSSEGFPNVIGEAMSAGLPVVAFDCMAGPSDIIIDQVDGFLIPLFDFSQFQNKMLYLMENENVLNRMGNNAESNIHRFSVELISEQYFKCILSL